MFDGVHELLEIVAHGRSRVPSQARPTLIVMDLTPATTGYARTRPRRLRGAHDVLIADAVRCYGQ